MCKKEGNVERKRKTLGIEPYSTLAIKLIVRQRIHQRHVPEWWQQLSLAPYNRKEAPIGDLSRPLMIQLPLIEKPAK